MSFLNSNIPFKSFSSSTNFEIIRLARSTSGSLTFIMLVNKLMEIISKQGIQKKDIKILLNKIFGHCFEVFSKFAVTPKEFQILFKLDI